MIKDCKLKILICFKSPLTKHWTRLHKTSHVLPIPLLNWKISVMLEVLAEKLISFLSFRIRKTMCEDLTSYEFLIHWPIYPGEFDILVALCNKYIIIFYILLSKEGFNHDVSLPNLNKEKTWIGRWKVRNKKERTKVQKGNSIKSESKWPKTPK